MARQGVFELSPDWQSDPNSLELLDQAAQAWTEDLLVIDNNTVFALGGNANNENLQTRIVEVKEGGRGVKQPVGWTVPFDERALAAFDVNLLQNQGIRKLLRNPEELTARLGGLTFIRGTADIKAKEAYAIPDCIIPPLLQDAEYTTVQLYSPEGVTLTENLTRAALSLGAEPVMTSANRSGQPESVTVNAAVNFVETTKSEYKKPQAVVTYQTDMSRSERPRGSYPVVIAEPERFVIKRPGCFEPAILEAALAGYSIVVDTAPEPVKYPDSILRMIDLPQDVRKLRGAEFRLGLLATLNW